MLRRLPIPVPTRFDPFPLGGGLDLHTPLLQLKPGYVRDALNWECSINGGYTRIPGYERFDGRPAPSAASYTVLDINITGSLSVGNAVNGQTSGATGVVAAISGSQVVVTKQVGTFQVGENFRVSTTVVGTVTTVGAAVISKAVEGTYRIAAQAIYRSDILAVPGSGAVRGVVVYNGTVYAVRNNVGGTAAVFHRHSGSGWTAITMPYELSFTGGSGTAPNEGATITKGAVSATMLRMCLQSGSFAGGTAAGRMIISAPSGGSFTAGAFTGGITATCAGAETQISFLPNGRFEMRVQNAGNGMRIYGCDGVNRGFEFDGTVMAPIVTGMATDAPTHVNIHRKQVFFSFAASTQHSAPGTPFVWSAVFGASELLVDQPITAFETMPGSENNPAMAIFGTDTTSILYGSGVSDWKLSGLNLGIGAKAYSVRSVGRTYLFDDSGVVNLEGTQSFGNFSTTSLTQNLRSYTSARKTILTDSCFNFERKQYRMFFSDGSALYNTIVNNRFLGAMPMQFLMSPFVVANGEATNTGEVTYVGATDGFVYQLDIGSSFDGAAIESRFQLTFANQRNSRILKTYHKAVFEIQGTDYAEFSAAADLAYTSDETEQITVATKTAGVYWDEFTWDEFTWDGTSLAPNEWDFDGEGENIAVRISSSDARWPEFTINSLILHYKERRPIW